MTLQRKTELRSDPEKWRATQRRGAERYAKRVRKHGRRPLTAMSQRKRDELAARGQTAPSSSLRRSAPKRRDREIVNAEERATWHLLVCRSRWCVKGCGRRAGPHGDHAIEKQWLLSHPLLAPHAWDLEVGVGACETCHSRHTTRVERIARAELIAAGYWQTLTDWARMLDARYFPDGHEPVLSRLEHDYPEIP